VTGPEIFAIAMVLMVIIALLRGFPVAFTLAGVSLLFAGAGILTGQFEPAFLRAFPQRIYGAVMTNELLIAVPLFVFMGVMLEKSRIAEELLDSMGKLFGPLPGGLGVSVVIVGALLAASTGIVGATVVTMGLLSLPTMLKRGYSPELASGAITASGTLGQIIPPSIVLILLGDQISNAYQSAQRTIGNFAPEPVSVGDLFAGALIPGMLMVGLYIAYVLFVALTRPAKAPPVPREARQGPLAFAAEIAVALAPPLILIVAVLGSILAGLATATEAAALGALGATLLAGFRNAGEPANPRFGRWAIALGALALVALIVLGALVDLRLGRAEVSAAEAATTNLAYVLSALAVLGALWAGLRLLINGKLGDVSRSTAEISAMVFVILIGATLFSLVFRGFGGDEMVSELLTGIPGGKWGALVAVMAMMFVLGFFLDFIEITFVVVPIVAPALFIMGVDPVWLGVLMAMNLQTSFLTPPFGFALFYLRGVAPPEVATGQIYRGAIPFVILQLLALALVAAMPATATWLPGVLAG